MIILIMYMHLTYELTLCLLILIFNPKFQISVKTQVLGGHHDQHTAVDLTSCEEIQSVERGKEGSIIHFTMPTRVNQ